MANSQTYLNSYRISDPTKASTFSILAPRGKGGNNGAQYSNVTLSDGTSKGSTQTGENFNILGDITADAINNGANNDTSTYIGFGTINGTSGVIAFDPNGQGGAGYFVLTGVNLAAGTTGIVTLASSTPTTWWTLGGTGTPSAPSIITFTDNAGSIRGSFPSGVITDDTSPRLGGKGDAGATIRISLNGAASPVGTVVATSSGTWNWTPSPPLAEGSYSVTATQTNTSGATSVASPAFNATIDTTAPAVASVPDLAPVSDSGTSSKDNITNIASQMFTGTAEADSTVTIFSDGVPAGTGVATGGSYSITTSALTDGAHSITANATDIAGNVSATSSALPVTMDSTAPNRLSITSVTDDVLLGTGTLPVGGSTNDANLTVQVNLTGTGAAVGDKVQLYDGGGTTSPLGGYTLVGNNITNGSASVQTGQLATTGTVNLTARLIDQAANVSGASSVFTVNEDPSAVCYAAGTRILTGTGERMVDELKRGDVVLTLSGEELSGQPVKWVGRRRIDLTAHPRPETVAPVRIQRGAFADDMPHTDLLVSPDHAIFVDGKLICARQLINGTTIHQEKGWTSVDYFHVELDLHAILLAEGLPAESYLNTGNQGFFANSREPLLLHPDLTDETDYPTREAASCAPFAWDAASVRPVWQRLADRAVALGQPAPNRDTTTDAGLHIAAGAHSGKPIHGENGRYMFVVPRGTTEVRLVSRACVPTDTRPWLDDRRCLGVSVNRIVLHCASELLEIPVDHPSLSQGWCDVERDGAILRRWTDGDALLPLPPCSEARMLEIRADSSEMIYLSNVEQAKRAA